MIRPHFFKANSETAGTNIFQQVSSDDVSRKAIEEFDHAVNRLRMCGVTVNIYENENSEAPDAVFPNNWISFHHNSVAIIYPMMANSRRNEKEKRIIESLEKSYNIETIVDLSHYEKENKFLEGTGSLVFDHRSKIAYACLSGRTHKELVFEVCAILGYKPFVFSAFVNEKPLYHTNVMLHVGNKYAIVCLEAITDVKERNDLRRMLAFTGHEVVPITLSQLRMFAGNMLEVINKDGKHFTLLSSTAIRTLHLGEINVIGESSELLSFDLSTIEQTGGGSIRCMMAEIFCPLKTTVT